MQVQASYLQAYLNAQNADKKNILKKKYFF